MLLVLLAYLGGVLTILSPCILPVLPFVFARADQPFRRSGLPLLAGMAATFALVASAAALGGGWVVTANQAGRWAALALMALFALTLLLPGWADRLTRPLVAAGARLARVADGGEGRPATAFLLGIATGLLWAPCAGPILGLLLAGAALNGASTTTLLLLLAYGAGAATSLGLALLAGGRVFALLKRSLHAGEWIRRGLGAAMLAGVIAIALGLDTGALAALSTASTAGLEQDLVDHLTRPRPAAARTALPEQTLPVEGMAPPLDGAVQWLNSPPLTLAGLRGKVVLVDFWTYSCINCLRTLPYVKAWAAKYRDQGLVVIGVHSPEFAFERDPANVAAAVARLGISYPVALDNRYAMWNAFANRYWPAHYFIDAQGRIRHHHFGEGGYAESERVIQTLLREAGAAHVAATLVETRGQGVQRAAAETDERSPETYLGYGRAERCASAPITPDAEAAYQTPAALPPDGWGLSGRWIVGAEQVRLAQAGGRILYRFHARDLHLVLGPGPGGAPVRFRVGLDGHPPGPAHGVDTAADGSGLIRAQRLYQLIRQPGPITDHVFSIEFLDPGAEAYAFTFG
ncbi:thiol-disulfide oxidoreductase YkuV [mine drainage metagenome]|uniref:Thiol-disulfide oxidoreductase YkuV n=1 Tax=mine drainage metagenome TaxID=410659 RepID=A0A1J5SHY7_9ZZZZ